MKKTVWLFLSTLLMVFFMSSSSQGALQTAAHLVADALMDEMKPKTTQIAYLEGGDVILAAGRNEGLRFGQRFEIYSQTDYRYLGVVRVVEVRTRIARAHVLEKIHPMNPGDWADETFGGTAALYGFLDSQGQKTPFTQAMLTALAGTLTGHGVFQVMKERLLESSLESFRISHYDLVQMDVIRAGDLLGTDLVVVGLIEEKPQEIILHVRINETAYGRMLSSTSLELTRTSALEDLLDSGPERESTIAWMEVRPSRPSLLPGESIELQLFCYDAQGFLMQEMEPKWSVTGDFVSLSQVIGQKITVKGVYSGRGLLRVVVEDETLFVEVEVREDIRLVNIIPSPQTLELPVGASHVFWVEGKDQYGDAMEISPEWKILSGFGTLSQTRGKSNEFTAMGAGETVLQVEKDAQEALIHIQVTIPMQQAPGTSFPQGLNNETEATVPHDFWIGETPVTYALWYPVRIWARENGYTFSHPGREGSHGTEGGLPTGDLNQPVTNVNWNDCIVWCNALSEYLNFEPVYLYQGQVIKNALDTTACNEALQGTGNGFRLPTSDEWELAARYRGTDSSHGALEHPVGSNQWWTPGNFISGAWGPSSFDPAAGGNIQEIAWYRGNTQGTQEVGQKPEKGNPLGLYDMSGNVWEWCFDGDAEGRVIRGGCWMSIPAYLQVGFYFMNEPQHKSRVKGFRLVQNVE